MTLESRDLKLRPLWGCITMSLVSTLKGRANESTEVVIDCQAAKFYHREQQYYKRELEMENQRM